MDIWNKVIQALLLSGGEDSLLLSCMLIDDVHILAHTRYLTEKMSREYNLPLINGQLDTDLYRILRRYYNDVYQRVSTMTPEQDLNYLINYKKHVDNLE